MSWPRFSDLHPVTLLFLRKGPNWTAEDSDASRQLQMDHIAFLKSIRDAGHAAIVGPMLDNGDLRAACVYFVPIDEALALAATDPAVSTGHLTVEAHPWMIEKAALEYRPPASS